MGKPALRIIHNLARSGSTLMCKCLGCMHGVALLSEIHPHAMRKFNPLEQARQWFGLLTEDDLASLRNQGEIGFGDAIALIEQRCRERGKTLLLRDWAHLDYTGYPFTLTPGYQPMIYAELSQRFDILRVATVREPVGQWLSLVQYLVMTNLLRPEPLTLEHYLLGYRKYAELCVETGFIRYEDFLRQPEATMQKLCGQLRIDYDPAFIDHWHGYKSITGDTQGGKTIKPASNRPVQPELRQQFLDNADYRQAIELLGYEPIQA